jgi:5-methyltetrahydrofolate--homocysteine methyltransferase
MKKGVACLIPYMQKDGEKQTFQGTIVLATVKGDVHDIGKKIVEVVLQCNNFRVVDLGVMVPANDIIDAVIREKADIVGLSGLITPSLDEMVHVASEMKNRSVSIPLLVGGATTSKKHTAVRISPAAGNTVIHVADASLAVPVCQKLVSTAGRESYVAEISAEYHQIRNTFESEQQSSKVLPLEKAVKRKLSTDWTKYQPPRPARPGITLFRDYPLAELRKYINWTFMYKAWEMDKSSGKEAEKLFQDANTLLDKIISDKLLTANGVAGIFRAQTNTDYDIEIYGDDAGQNKISTIFCMRQQIDRGSDKPCLSLADYIATKDSCIADYAGMFAVTAGIGVDKLIEQYEQEKDDYNVIMAKVLADRLSEAFAEKLHEIVRKELWGYTPDEKLTLDEMFRVKYRGIRPAPGYPACPDHSLKRELFHTLSVDKNCGISLTESHMMVPVASVCGYYFSHPDSTYFAVNGVTEEQEKSYALRRKKNLTSR